MSARLKHIASLVTVVLLAVAMTASGQQPPTEKTEQPEGTPPRASLLRPALEAAVASAWLKALDIPDPPAGTWGVVASGTGGGAVFRDADSEAEAWLGTAGIGVVGFGATMGGYFVDSNSTGVGGAGVGDVGIVGNGSFAGGSFADSEGSGEAYVGYGDYGISAKGHLAGGYFYDSGASGSARVGYGDRGIEASGLSVGGYFKDVDSGAEAYVGYGDKGIEASGSGAGGYFYDSDNSGEAWVGNGNYGIVAKGATSGGYFLDKTDLSAAWVAYGGYGIDSWGLIAGGKFHDDGGSGFARVAYGDYGIDAKGNYAGGSFRDADSSGEALLGYVDLGIQGSGNTAGGYFFDKDNTAFGYVAYGTYGVYGAGDVAGGHFYDKDAGSGKGWIGYSDTGVVGHGDLDGGFFLCTGEIGTGVRAEGATAGGDFSDSGGARATVASWDYKISGNGKVSFIQNHPEDPSSVIVYAAPEGDEVATYTRGSARLTNGEAIVELGETFKWVTNPDIGLTAHLTPVGAGCVLYVAEKSTDRLVVRSADPSDCAFDYLVYGLRIGFEGSSVVQEKEWEAWIPSMRRHRELLARRPELGRFTALSRFAEQREALGVTDELDTSRAEALVAAIHEFDPAVDSLERPVQPGSEEWVGGDGSDGGPGRRQTAEAGEGVSLAQPHRDGHRVPGRSTFAAPVPEDDEGNVYATSFRPSSGELASLVRVSEAVEPGDVLVIDRSSTGMMRRGFEGHDTGVVGVVSANAGVVLGSQPPALGNGGSVATPRRAELAMAGVVSCKADAAYGPIWPGDLLVSSPNPGHAMRVDAPLPGTIVGKALEPLAEGTGRIRVLVMLR